MRTQFSKNALLIQQKGRKKGPIHLQERVEKELNNFNGPKPHNQIKQMFISTIHWFNSYNREKVPDSQVGLWF